jgi:hypothetical protein
MAFQATPRKSTASGFAWHTWLGRRAGPASSQQRDMDQCHASHWAGLTPDAARARGAQAPSLAGMSLTGVASCSEVSIAEHWNQWQRTTRAWSVTTRARRAGEQRAEADGAGRSERRSLAQPSAAT